MRRAALMLATLGGLCLLAGQTTARADHGKTKVAIRYADLGPGAAVGYHQVHGPGHGHGYGHYGGPHWGGAVIVRPPVYAPPPVVVPYYGPPAVVYPPVYQPYYYRPYSGLNYYGRNFSLGIAF